MKRKIFYLLLAILLVHFAKGQIIDPSFKPLIEDRCNLSTVKLQPDGM